MDFDHNSILYFYSTIAQVYGALLGLLGIGYIRIKEDQNSNMRELVSAFSNEVVAPLRQLES